jgi:hypothetical protein
MFAKFKSIIFSLNKENTFERIKIKFSSIQSGSLKRNRNEISSSLCLSRYLFDSNQVIIHESHSFSIKIKLRIPSLFSVDIYQNSLERSGFGFDAKPKNYLTENKEI